MARSPRGAHISCSHFVAEVVPPDEPKGGGAYPIRMNDIPDNIDDFVDDLLNAGGTDNHAHDQAPATSDGLGSQESLLDISSQEFRDAGMTSQDFRDIAHAMHAMPSGDVPPSNYGLGISDLLAPGVGPGTLVPVSEPGPSNRMIQWEDLNLMIVHHEVHKRDPLRDGSIECAAHLNMHPPACAGAVVPMGDKPPTQTPCTSARARRAYRARLCLRAALSRAPIPR